MAPGGVGAGFGALTVPFQLDPVVRAVQGRFHPSGTISSMSFCCRKLKSHPWSQVLLNEKLSSGGLEPF